MNNLNLFKKELESRGVEVVLVDTPTILVKYYDVPDPIKDVCRSRLIDDEIYDTIKKHANNAVVFLYKVWPDKVSYGLSDNKHKYQELITIGI